MKNLFNPENKLFTLIGIVGDHVLVGLLWLVSSLPIVTVGAASTAAYSVSFKILNEEGYGVFKDFFGTFKREFKLSTQVWMVFLAVGLLLLADFYFYLEFTAANTSWTGVIFGVISVITFLYLICLIWINPYIARFQSGFIQAIKLPFMIGIVNLGYSFLLLVGDAAIVVLCVMVSFLIPFIPGLILLFNSLCIRRVFRKYTNSKDEKSND